VGMSADSQKRRNDVGRGASYDAKDGGRRGVVMQSRSIREAEGK
jgi:hypothetical protein